jgi:phage gp16-like protein
MQSTNDIRRRDLSKIHIAKKDLALDDDTYRVIVSQIGGAASGSSADLDLAGRRKVLEHFKSKGWKPRKARASRAAKSAARTSGGEILASDGQVKMIRSIWIQMSDAGVIKNRMEQGLRAWVKAETRRYHRYKAGYSAPEFLPAWVAQKVIEHLKGWAGRCLVELHE